MRLLLLDLAAAGITYVITAARIASFIPRQRWYVLRCPFCMAFWVTAGLSLIGYGQLELSAAILNVLAAPMAVGTLAALPTIIDLLIGILRQHHAINTHQISAGTRSIGPEL